MGLREFASVPPDPRDWGRWMRAQFITADSVAPNTITTGMIVDANVTFAKIQNLNALSVLGRSVNSAGVGGNISAANDGEILRRNGAVIGFGSILSTSVSDFTEAAQDAVAAALTDTTTIDLTYTDATPAVTADVRTDSISNTLLANMAQDTIKGRTSGAGTGDPVDLTAAQVATIVSTAVASALNIGNVASYTPTLTNVANLSASTANLSWYIRVRDAVFVWGFAGVDPTAAGTAELGISLPIASNFGANTDLVGVSAALAVAGQSAGILADTTNDRARLIWVAVDTANNNMFYLFGYRVI